MKKSLAVIFAFFVLALFQISASAEIKEDIEQSTGAESLYEEFGEDRDFSGVFDTIKDSIKNFTKTITKTIFLMLSIVLLSSVFTAYGGTGILQKSLTYGSVLALSGCAFSMLTSVFSLAQSSIAEQCRYMTAFLPVSASIYMAGGSMGSGIASSTALLTFLSLAGNFVSSFLFPLMQGGFVLSLSASLPFGNALKSVTTLAKNTLTTLLAFVFSIFGMIMYLQTVITAAADSFAFRSIKFATGAFIPVIGNMIGDAARTVASSAGVIRASVGGAGIIALLCVILPSVIYTLLYKLGVLLCAMGARALGCDAESRLLYDCNSIMSVLLALQTGIGVMFIIAVALFIRVGVNV